MGDDVRQKFTGYERDNETGLDFAEARYYNNFNGRFTAVDPLLASGRSANPQTFNRYAYVMNRPLNLIDPTGLDPCASAGDGANNGMPQSCEDDPQRSPRKSGSHPEPTCPNGCQISSRNIFEPGITGQFSTTGVFTTEEVRGGELIPEGVPAQELFTDTYFQRTWNLTLELNFVDSNGQRPDFEYEVTYETDNASSSSVGGFVEGRQSSIGGEALVGTFEVRRPQNYAPGTPPRNDLPDENNFRGAGSVTIFRPDGRSSTVRFEVRHQGSQSNPVILMPQNPFPIVWR